MISVLDIRVSELLDGNKVLLQMVDGTPTCDQYSLRGQILRLSRTVIKRGNTIKVQAFLVDSSGHKIIQFNLEPWQYRTRVIKLLEEV